MTDCTHGTSASTNTVMNFEQRQEFLKWKMLKLFKVRLFILLFCVHSHFLITHSLVHGNLRLAQSNEFRSFVTVGKKRRMTNLLPHIFCSGVLITQRHVLTGPDCVSLVEMDQARVYAGSVDMILSVEYEIEAWKKYSEWNPNGNQLFHKRAPDIAIITLVHPTDERKMRPAIVSDRSTQDIYGLETIVLGWDNPDSKHQNRKLMSTFMVISSKEECAAFTREPMKTFIRNERVMCSVSETQLNEYDEGGPLLRKDLVGNYYILGINWKLMFKLPRTANTFINTRYFIDFIDAYVESELSRSSYRLVHDRF